MNYLFYCLISIIVIPRKRMDTIVRFCFCFLFFVLINFMQIKLNLVSCGRFPEDVFKLKLLFFIMLFCLFLCLSLFCSYLFFELL